MSEQQAIAQLKAAAWALVALVGFNKAMSILSSLVAELDKASWGDRGR